MKLVARSMVVSVTHGARRVLGAAGLAAFAGTLAVGGTALASAPAAPTGSAYVLHDLQCDQHDNGVLDLTLVNDDPSAPASFTVATSATPVQYGVAALSARAVTMTNLADGPVVVPVMINGVSSEVSVTVACDPPQVEVAPPTVPAPAATAVAPGPGLPVVNPLKDASGTAARDSGFMLPSTGSSVRGLVVGGVLVVAGIAASLLARRRYS